MLKLRANFKEEIVIKLGNQEVVIRLYTDEHRPVLGIEADRSVVIYRRRVDRVGNGRK